jgi:hypothetical protein
MWQQTQWESEPCVGLKGDFSAIRGFGKLLEHASQSDVAGAPSQRNDARYTSPRLADGLLKTRADDQFRGVVVRYRAMAKSRSLPSAR